MERSEGTPDAADHGQKMQFATDIAVRLGLLALMAILCFRILAPFVEIVLWAMIIAIAIDRPFERMSELCGGRRKLVATGIVIVTLVGVCVPSVLLTETLISGAQDFSAQVKAGEVQVPPPPDKVAGWPVIGKRLHGIWLLASENLSEALVKMKPQLAAASRWLLGAAGSAGAAVLQLLASVIIASIMLVNSRGRKEAMIRFMSRLAPQRGKQFAELAFATIQSVVQGLLGVAILQALLAGGGFLVAGIPAAGLWALLVMVAAIVQVPVLLVMIPPILLGFSVLSTPIAIVYTIWCIVVALIDNVLKPILFGRGVQVPTVVIFLGAIGGMLAMGIIGLFLGAVLLALGYELVTAWMGDAESTESTEGA